MENRRVLSRYFPGLEHRQLRTFVAFAVAQEVFGREHGLGIGPLGRIDGIGRQTQPVGGLDQAHIAVTDLGDVHFFDIVLPRPVEKVPSRRQGLGLNAVFAVDRQNPAVTQRSAAEFLLDDPYFITGNIHHRHIHRDAQHHDTDGDNDQDRLQRTNIHIFVCLFHDRVPLWHVPVRACHTTWYIRPGRFRVQDTAKPPRPPPLLAN